MSNSYEHIVVDAPDMIEHDGKCTIDALITLLQRLKEDAGKDLQVVIQVLGTPGVLLPLAGASILAIQSRSSEDEEWDEAMDAFAVLDVTLDDAINLNELGGKEADDAD